MQVSSAGIPCAGKAKFLAFPMLPSVICEHTMAYKDTRIQYICRHYGHDIAVAIACVSHDTMARDAVVIRVTSSQHFVVGFVVARLFNSTSFQ